MFEDSNGNLWIGTDGGLEKFNRADDSFTHYRHNAADDTSLPNDFVRIIFEDSRGYLWIGTSGGGLSKFDVETEKFTTYIHEDDNPYRLINNIVRTIYDDSRGYLWIGTWNGLDRFGLRDRTVLSISIKNWMRIPPRIFWPFGRSMRGVMLMADVFITTVSTIRLSTYPNNRGIIYGYRRRYRWKSLAGYLWRRG